MNGVRIGVVMVVQNDAETIERALRSFYPQVEAIIVSTDLKRGWSGQPITPDTTLDIVRELDTDGKIEIVTGDFCRGTVPIANETVQRQEAADRLAVSHPGLDWILQIDADEEFLDFGVVREALADCPATVSAFQWRWLTVFNTTENGRLLLVTDNQAVPLYEPFALGHRPGTRLKVARNVELPENAEESGRLWTAPANLPYGKGVLHYSYAKSEARVREKLDTWGHSDAPEKERFFAQWQRSRTDWQAIRDFHLLGSGFWPTLSAYSTEELRGLLQSVPALLQREAGDKRIRILIGHRDFPLPPYDTTRFDVRVVRFGMDGVSPPVTMAEMRAQCPPDWKPDVYYHHALVHFPIPTDIEDFDGLTVSDIQDWHRGGRAVWAGVGFFDLVATERNAVALLKANGYENAVFARFWGVDPQMHRVLPNVKRDIDVLFIGSLQSEIWGERNRWLDRLAALSDRYKIVIASGHYGDDYVRLTNRAKIVFNRSVNGCTNQRAYDAPACGALVFNEAENDETREIFADGGECVYYTNDNFEQLLEYYLTHDAERERIVANAQRKVLAEHTETAHTNALFALFAANLDKRGYRPNAKLKFEERQWAKALQIYACALPGAVPTALQLIAQASPVYELAEVAEAQAALQSWAAHYAANEAKIKGLTAALTPARQAYRAQSQTDHAPVTYGFMLLERAEATQGAHPSGRNDIIEAAVALAIAAERAESNALPHATGFVYPRWRDTFDAYVERAFLLRDADFEGWAEALRIAIAWRCRSILSDLAYANGQQEEALKQARGAAEVLPVEGEAWLRLARCEATSGLLEDAVAHYRAGLALQPLAYAAWPELAAVLVALNRRDEAQSFIANRLRVLQAIPAFAAIRPALTSVLEGSPQP